MHIREYQQWLQAWDEARGWDQVSPSHTLMHAFEEMGEVARLILQWEGYKASPSDAEWRAEFEEELSDVLLFLFKLAYQVDVDVEEALARGQAKADGRHPDLELAGAELRRYHARQAELQGRLMSEGDDL